MVLERDDGSELEVTGYLKGDDGFAIASYLQTPYTREFGWIN